MNAHDDNKEVLLLTSPEACKRVRNAPVHSMFYLHVWADAKIVDSPNEVYRDGLHGSVKLTREAALKLLKDFLRKGLEEKGGRIPMMIQKTKYLAKNRRTGAYEDTHYNSYWIG